MAEREFDLVLWGATGYTGKLVARYLNQQSETNRGLRWALAGRNPEKLERLLADLGASTRAVLLLSGDANDSDSMVELARRTRVVCSTVGPYATYGSGLVRACAENGTHYCDLTGEVPWIRDMIDRFEPAARESGARIVFCCGFDSIPSDLGVFYLNAYTKEHTGEPCRRIINLVTTLKGGVSGGTATGLIEQVEDMRRSPSTRRLLSHPYALNPEGEQHGSDTGDRATVRWDRETKNWTAPFIMAVINTRVVRRSNALLHYAYGRDFSYSEVMATGSGMVGMLKALSVIAALGLLAGVLAFAPSRALARRFFPKPGTGPSTDQRMGGRFEYTLIGEPSVDGAGLMRCRVGADVDPGYEATSRMLAESAVCLAVDEDQIDVKGGMWTPASAMGSLLLDRLRKNAGMWFRIESPPAAGGGERDGPVQSEQ